MAEVRGQKSEVRRFIILLILFYLLFFYLPSSLTDKLLAHAHAQPQIENRK